jgi:hypothetical protein
MHYLNFIPSPQSQSTALLDLGCTVYFLIANANAHFKNKVLTQTPLEVFLPNGATIASTHTATLNLPSLPNAARQAHILPGLDQHSLLSVGKMCDSGCAITFTANKVAVTHGATTILTVQRDKESGMWRVPLGNTNSAQAAPEHFVHNGYEQKSIQDTITYLHTRCFSPVQNTWIKDIGYFATWSSVTVDNARKYLQKSDAMVKGHMNQIRRSIRATQPAVVAPTPESELVQEYKFNFMYAAIMETNQIYRDLTGVFPTTSLIGNTYSLILYDYDSNIVLSAPMKNRGDKEMVRAFDLLIQSLIIRGLKHSLQCLDN